MEIYNNLNNYFIKLFKDLPCNELTKSYICSIFSSFKNSNNDLSNESITLIFYEAKLKNNFILFQNLGDYIFFSKSYLNNLNYASEDYYTAVAQLSYYSCYKLSNKQLKIYEELADEFNNLNIETKKILCFSFNLFCV